MSLVVIITYVGTAKYIFGSYNKMLMIKLILYTSCLLALMGCNPMRCFLPSEAAKGSNDDSKPSSSVVSDDRESTSHITKIYPSRVYRVTNPQNDFFLTAIQSKFLQDMTAFKQLGSLGVQHCIDESDFLSLYGDYYNNMYPITRLTNKNMLTNKLAEFEKNQNVKNRDEKTCSSVYLGKFSYDVYRKIIKDDSMYSPENGYDTLQDRIDYLNLGIIELRRFVDIDLHLPETIEQDEKVIKDYQALGMAYCMGNDKAYNILRQSMIDRHVALPILFKNTSLRDSFDKIIVNANIKERTYVDCNRLFTSIAAKYQFKELVNNYDSYYLYEDELPDGIINPTQNMLDYLNLGEIDSKRFIYDLE